MPRSGKVKAAEELPNLERSAIRLDGIEIYSVIGALQAGTSVGLMQEVGLNTLVDPFSYQGQDIDLVWTILSTVFLISGTVATLGGIYSTVIFALCSLYGKTALGMDRDRMYVYFMKNTGELRKRAFTGFTTSLLLFCLQGESFRHATEKPRQECCVIPICSCHHPACVYKVEYFKTGLTLHTCATPTHNVALPKIIAFYQSYSISCNESAVSLSHCSDSHCMLCHLFGQV